MAAAGRGQRLWTQHSVYETSMLRWHRSGPAATSRWPAEGGLEDALGRCAMARCRGGASLPAAASGGIALITPRAVLACLHKPVGSSKRPCKPASATLEESAVRRGSARPAVCSSIGGTRCQRQQRELWVEVRRAAGCLSRAALPAIDAFVYHDANGLQRCLAAATPLHCRRRRRCRRSPARPGPPPAHSRGSSSIHDGQRPAAHQDQHEAGARQLGVHG